MVQNRTDLRYYNSPAEFPDYGSWFCSAVKNNIMEFAGGLSTEIDKLPVNVGRGATALCTDGSLYINKGETGTSADWVAMVE